MALFLTLFALLAAPHGEKWSEKHGVGLFVPQGWTVLKRDEGDRAFVIEGPKLGPGYPRAVLWSLGPAADTPLAKAAEALRAKVRGKKDWTIVSESRKELDGFPAVRFGIRFREDGARGRARFTVALLGTHFYVLELSASARNFPARAFDRLERSLRVKWTTHEIAGLTIETPGAWALVDGQLRGGDTVLAIELAKALEAPPGAKPGPHVEFLGKPRPTLDATNEERGLTMRVVVAEGRRAIAIAPTKTWPDQAAVVARILKTARAKPK